jgi:hypothetical protein
MASEAPKREFGKAVLKFFSIESPYRRVARFYPALMTISLLLPVAIMLGIPLQGWIAALAAGGGLAVSTATVGLLTHLAAAAGNRIQSKLYPRWPHDSPTNLRLHPSDGGSSKQQKQVWYEAIRRLTGIDIASVAADPEEAERAINDALVVLRTKVFHGNKLAERLEMHNADYGFVRNFTGLRPAWLLTSFASCAGCWATYALRRDGVALPVIATAIFVGCVLASLILESYVRHVARHYADSLFGALDACDEAIQAKAKRQAAKPFTP